MLMMKVLSILFCLTIYTQCRTVSNNIIYDIDNFITDIDNIKNDVNFRNNVIEDLLIDHYKNRGDIHIADHEKHIRNIQSIGYLLKLYHRNRGDVSIAEYFKENLNVDDVDKLSDLDYLNGLDDLINPQTIT